MNESIDLLERLREIDPQSKILFTTFKYNQDFFETQIFPHFKSSYPLILIDQNEYQNHIHDLSKSKNAERKFFLEQIECTSTFHPKIMLAISQEKIWLWIGSNNLTYEGFLKNAEIVIPILINRNDKTDIKILPQIEDLLGSLKSIVKSSPHRNAIQDMIDDLASGQSVKEQDVYILHNINKKPLFDQILSIIDRKIIRISVISPFYSQDKKFYQRMLKHCNDIHIIVQQNTSNLPVDQIKNFKGLQFSHLEIEDERYLHAKIFFLQTKREKYIFCGSANFTEAAILTNNNVEAGILFKSPLSVQSLVKKIGVLRQIPLNEIQSHPQETDDESHENIRLKIVESVREGSLLRVIVNDSKGLSNISLLLNGNPINLSYHMERNQIIFTLPDDLLYHFDKTAIVEIEAFYNNKPVRSDGHLVYNKMVFPDGLDILNNADINNKNWLFRLLSKLMKLPNFSEYIPVLLRLDERSVFTENVNPVEFQGFPLAKGPYDPNAQLKELIEKFIQKHQHRVERAIHQEDCSNPVSAVNSFILTNKLIIWSVVNEFESIEKLHLVKNNLEAFFRERKSFLSLIPSKNLPDLLQESQLKYHTALFVFIIDYLQKKSKKYQPDERLGYNTVKDVFETSMMRSLSQMMAFEDMFFDNDILQGVLDQYAEIVPSISKFSPNDIERNMNTLMASVEIRIGKKLERLHIGR